MTKQSYRDLHFLYIKEGIIMGCRVGQISAYGSWASYPDVSTSIRKEAEELTSSYRSLICEYYAYNAENGADY